jgi:amino acid adenylation domain-containing protein
MKDNLLQSRLSRIFSNFKCRPALQSDTRQVTYDELEKRSTFIAQRLLEKGVGKESFVGILLEERIDLITAIIGVVKAGCVFVPLDPVYPPRRLKQMIQLTDARYVIIDAVNSRRLGTDEPDKREKVEYLEWEEFRESAGPLSPQGKYCPQDRIYIYFTSGTTGQPRAIVGKHEGLLHFIDWEIERFGIDETFRFSQFTNPGFDVFLRDIFVPLCAGGTICIPGSEVKTGAASLIDWIHRQDINLIHCVPSLFRVFNTDALEPGHFKDLKYILFAGEKVIPQELKNWYATFSDRVQLVNLYGPTETTLAKIYYPIQPADSEREIMPIGKPINGARAFILSENLELCEKLASGEIYLRTPYHTYGYLNDPQSNREKFIPNPYSRTRGDFLYKTGDLGRLLPDGNIELSGRVDRQVKLQGIRIELDEIENTLLKHPQVMEAVVIKRTVEGTNEFLSAFITGTAEPGETGAIRQYLEERLPEQMIPAYIHGIEQIPRKANGKVDYDEISRLADTVETEYVPPNNDIEMKLVEIWAELLQKPKSKIGITNSFFQLGGNSLNLMSLIGKIHKVFAKRISLGEIFQNVTVEKQAVLIEEALAKDFIPLQPVEEKEYYEATPAQNRIYLFSLRQQGEEKTVYNLPQIMIMEGEAEPERLDLLFRKLIRRYETLRSFFHLQEGRLVQGTTKEVGFEILCPNPTVEGEVDLNEISRQFITPFDLDKAPLLRVGLLKLGENKHVLMTDMHHIISDGISNSILINNFETLANGGQLPHLRIQYKDYTEWLSRGRQKQAIQQQEHYWLQEFETGVPELNLPCDYPRPPIHGSKGRQIRFSLSPEDTEHLKTLAQTGNVTLFLVVLTVYYILLSKLTGAEDIAVGTVVNLRNHSDLEGMIGMFINILVLRNTPKKELTFGEFLDQVKQRVSAAFENQEYPFEQLMDNVLLKRDLSHFPLYDAGFVLHDFSTPELPTGLNSFNFYRYPYETSAHIGEDLYLEGHNDGKQLHFTLRYYEKLFKEETIRRFVTYFQELVTVAGKKPGKKIKEMLSRQEEQRDAVIQTSRQEIPMEFNL